MYGGSGKLGRGRGGGSVKRNIHSAFQPSSVQRPPTTLTGAGHRNRSTTPVTAASLSTADETFSLVRNQPLNFGMIIRLSPVLVEEIKRLEAQGGAARIKFDSVANNPVGNVINVGDKDFRFTWSQETGDLCDIYEERQSGDNGNGLLVESGGAWRKLNVQRELDESFKNHVKMRTVEAERKHKSRKAIVLDHGNPSMKNQMKALAASEVNNTWRGSFNKKKEPPFKKMKAEPSSAAILPKSGGKAGLSSSTPSKAGASASPLLSTPEQSGAPFSPLRNSNLTKVHASREDATLTRSSYENASASEKEMPGKVSASIVQNKTGSKDKVGNKPTDLQSLLVSLLMEKPQGMNFKALEKAIGDTIPKSVKHIEPVLKKIAVFQAPGRYILKPDVELESFKKSLSESGSSPENNHPHREATAPESSFLLKADDMKEFEKPTHLISEAFEELNTSEKIDIEHHCSPDVLSEKKVSVNNEGPAASSSLSGSDSDSESDSSDSGSDSGSPSKSPVGSGSGSSSDSESDASANSKEGSDEDVDIMSDDDKEPNKHKLLLSTTPVPQTAPELGYTHNMVDEKDDGHGLDLPDLEKDLFGDDHEADMQENTNSFPDKDRDEYADEPRNVLIDRFEHQDSEVHARKLYRDQGNVARDVVPKTTSKRGSDDKHFDDNEHTKRLKSGSWAQPAVSRGRNSFSESPHSRSPDGPTMGRIVRDVNDYDYEKVENREFPVNSTSNSPRLGPRSIDLNARAKAHSPVKYSERGPQGNDVFSAQKDKIEDGYSKDRRPPKNSRLGVDGGKHASSHQKKHSGLVGKIKDSGLVSTSQVKDSPVDMKKSPVVNGRGISLRRELSDLEMGELREKHEETPGAKKRFDRNNSFKQLENKSSSDYWNLDVVSKGKPGGKTSPSPLQSGLGMSSNPQSVSKKAIPEDFNDDFTRPNGKSVQRETQLKAGSQHSKGRHNEAGVSQGVGPEGYVDGQRKVPGGAPQKHEKQVVPVTAKDNRRQKPNDLGDKRKDFWVVDSKDSGQKRREMESSSDDSIMSYTKYEKEEPEMKGPIRDLSQYNEYVQEYREKYDSYRTLNTILESYRNEFQSFGRELELAKGRDNNRYNKILERLMESYRQCGTKHKRLKKIFVVLHHELQHLKEMIKDFADKQTKG